MYRLFLALRYLAARPISWMSLIGIWLTVTCTLVAIAIFSGYLAELSDTYRSSTSDIILTPRLDREPRTTPYELLEAVLSTVDGVEASSPHLLRPALLRVLPTTDRERAMESIDEKNFVQVVGLDPKLDARTTGFPRHVAAERKHRVVDPERPFFLPQERLFASDRGLPVALIGTALFDELDLHVGQRLQLATLPEGETQDHFEPLSQDVVVGGAVASGFYPTDLRTVYVDLAAARAFARTINDTSEVCVKVRDEAQLDEVKRRIVAAAEEARALCAVQTWKEANAHYIGAVKSQRTILGVLLAFFILIACFNVFASLTILVTDKTRDIGVLAAMGATPRGILAVFVDCGLLMTASASVLGAATGAYVALHMNDIHEWIAATFGLRLFKTDVYFFDHIPIELDPALVVAIVLATIAFAVLCAVIPAARAARLDPVTALRFE